VSIIARAQEHKLGPLPKVADKDLINEFRTLNRELGIIERLARAVANNPSLPRGKNVILVFYLKGNQRLEVYSYDSITPAQEAYSKFENELQGEADIVLVKAEHAEDLKRSFQNYFTDAKDFVSLVTKAAGMIAKKRKGDGR
jgi:vacuolar-type H+-ATPase subunit F/Vma7